MTTYAIISLGDKQFRVSEGQRLLVDRLPTEEGKTFTPPVLLVGGDGGPQLSPQDVTVTARVVGSRRGPKIRIGKYKKRTGYRRRMGFRAALTQIEIESISGAAAPAPPKPKQEKPKQEQPQATREKEAAPPPAESASVAEGALPEGYADLTIAQLKEAASSWDAEAVQAALEYEQGHSNRKGAIAALQAAIATKESG